MEPDLRYGESAGKKIMLLVIIILLMTKPIAAYAETDTEAYPFNKGSKWLTLIFGRGTAYDNTYTIYGFGIGYYVQDGIEAGISVENWTGADPELTRVSPEVRYVFYTAPTIKPYFGTFYRHTFVDQHNDVNAIGVRAGAFIKSGRRLLIGLGAAHRRTLNCSGAECQETYPELWIGIIF